MTIRRHRQDFLNEKGVVVPYEDESNILGFYGKYRPLSNFHIETFHIDGFDVLCSETAYMMQKTDVLEEKRNLVRLATATEVKAYGQKVTLRSDWEEVKIAAMLKVLRAKFSQSEYLKELLLSTGEKYLEETNWWNDTFWGVCGGIGGNELGKLLMQVRTELRLGML